jgi:hypothetical protein
MWTGDRCGPGGVRLSPALAALLTVTMSKGMFMPARGVRMSENRITPSGLNARHGCRDTSTCVCVWVCVCVCVCVCLGGGGRERGSGGRGRAPAGRGYYHCGGAGPRAASLKVRPPGPLLARPLGGGASAPMPRALSFFFGAPRGRRSQSARGRWCASCTGPGTPAPAQSVRRRGGRRLALDRHSRRPRTSMRGWQRRAAPGGPAGGCVERRPLEAHLHVAASLAHHPHWGPLNGVTAQRAQHEGRVGRAGGGAGAHGLRRRRGGHGAAHRAARADGALRGDGRGKAARAAGVGGASRRLRWCSCRVPDAGFSRLCASALDFGPSNRPLARCLGIHGSLGPAGGARDRPGRIVRGTLATPAPLACFWSSHRRAGALAEASLGGLALHLGERVGADFQQPERDSEAAGQQDPRRVEPLRAAQAPKGPATRG